MEFVSRHTHTLDKNHIVVELTDKVQGDFDLAIVFVSAIYPYDIEPLIKTLTKVVKIRHVLACTAAGTIGVGEEFEGEPSASVLYCRLPGVKVTPFYLTQQTLESFEDDEDPCEWFGIDALEDPAFIMLPDPFDIDMQMVFDTIEDLYPGAPILGGLASGSTEEGGNTILFDDHVYHEGLVGVGLSGNIEMRSIVSQGCRPIGEPLIITRAEENIIAELGGRSFVDVLEDILKNAPPRDRMLAQEAILLGIAMDEYTYKFQRGDFLIRGVMGYDPNSKAGLISDFIEPGQTVQFHLRDATTAMEDLHEMLRRHVTEMKKRKPQGMLVFSCNGRGRSLFEEKDHDIQIIQSYLGGIPAAGFFSAGEIGPVGTRNFLHGFTSSIMLFYPKKK